MKYLCREIIIIICFLTMTTTCFGQNPILISKGKIVFEKRINAYGFLRHNFNDPSNPKLQLFADQYKANYPQFHTSVFNLYFNGSLSLYLPEQDADGGNFLDVIASKNIVFNNIKDLQSISKKAIAGNEYIIKQATRKIKWRYTNDTREIAGFHCHRANAIIMDSVYVVAFYTDQITAKAGPESFMGLPGMILEIALPQNYVVWEAKKVLIEDFPDTIFKTKIDGVKTTPKNIGEITVTFLKNNIGTVINWFLLIAQL